MTTKDAIDNLDLLSFYMKSYIDVISSFYKDNNKDGIYIKGSIAYQETLLTQTLGQATGGPVFVKKQDIIYRDKSHYMASFDTWKEAMFGELDYLKNNNPFKPLVFTVETSNNIDRMTNNLCKGIKNR